MMGVSSKTYKNKYKMNLRLLCSTVLIYFISFSVSAQEHLKILSYNIHHANPPSEQNGVIDLHAIAKVINDSDADLIGLQEVDVLVERSGKIDQAKELAKLTSRHYYFAKGIDLQGGKYGVAILSKSPILKSESYLLPMPVESEQRVAAYITTKLENGIEVIFGTSHFDLKDENKEAQAKFVAEYAKKHKKQIVIMTGDLNAEPASKTIDILDKVFTRSKIDNGATFPQINPNKEIDYIMFTNIDSTWIKNHKVIMEEYASDHCPLYVEIHFDNTL